ncbi:MAG TPA: FAD-dependent thymidylate synthase, partial [Pseudomonadales bacterium]|nr:FAD-dependent thymidylate synthase [Pseudomonadales bacterium]
TLRKALAGAVMSVSHAVSYASYTVLHKWLGVATEEARYTMPLSTATTFVVTAARADWDRVLTHRLSKDAQTDIRELVALIEVELNK